VILNPRKDVKINHQTEPTTFEDFGQSKCIKYELLCEHDDLFFKFLGERGLLATKLVEGC
jgi:hypothetical protein